MIIVRTYQRYPIQRKVYRVLAPDLRSAAAIWDQTNHDNGDCGVSVVAHTIVSLQTKWLVGHCRMPYTLRLGKIRITCDTIEELEAALASSHFKMTVPVELSATAKRAISSGEQKRRAAIKAQWDEVAKLAKAEGISKLEARRRLAKQKQSQ